MIAHGNCQFPQHPDYQNLLNINNKFYEEKIELQKKVHRRICVRFITFLAALPPFFRFFFFIFVYSNFTKKKILLQEMLAPYPPATPSVYGTDFTSLYILEKILLVKKHKKCVRYKKSKSLFFDILENIAKFSLQKLAFFKMITDSHIHILRLLPYMGKTRYPSKSQFFKSHFSTKW